MHNSTNYLLNRCAIKLLPVNGTLIRWILLAGVFVGSLASVPALAQEEELGEDRAGETEVASEAPADTADAQSARERRRRRARAPEWFADLSLAGIYDSNIRNDRDALTSYGTVLEAGLRFENHRSYPTLVLDYEIAGHTYTATETWDRVSHRGLASYIRRFDGNRWRWETMAWAHLGGVTVFDRELVDQYLLLSRVDYRLTAADRLRVYGAFRRKVYRDTTSGDANNPYAGAEFRHSFESGHALEIGYRYESNDAESARRDYTRSTASLEYDVPLGPRDQLSADLFYRRQGYPNRIVELGMGSESRVEHRWSPRVSWNHSFPQGWSAGVTYRYDRRFSNDPVREFDGHRLETLVLRGWNW